MMIAWCDEMEGTMDAVPFHEIFHDGRPAVGDGRKDTPREEHALTYVLYIHYSMMEVMIIKTVSDHAGLHYPVTHTHFHIGGHFGGECLIYGKL